MSINDIILNIVCMHEMMCKLMKTPKQMTLNNDIVLNQHLAYDIDFNLRLQFNFL